MVREYKRICKTPDCREEFVVAAASIEEDRALGLSEPEYCPKHRLLQVRSYSRIACHHIELEMTLEGEALVRRVEAQRGIGALTDEALLKGESDPWAEYGPGGVGRFIRPVRVFVDNQDFQPVKTKNDFKISEKSEEILAKLEEHQVMVLVGTTGSGKSTYVPWLLLTGGEPGRLSKWAKRGPICVTQPRIQATRQVPQFIANKLNGTSLGIGAQVGFSHSGADLYDRRTRLIFKTDGKLINDIVSGAVANYSIVIIDEAHERSVNIDLILSLLKDQLYLYPHLRLIIASATIDHETFIKFYGGERRVPLVLSEGIQYPVKKHWWGDPEDEWWKAVNKGVLPARQQLPRAIGELAQHICQWLDGLPGQERKNEDGHILVFLPGTREIDQTVSIINALDLPNVIALPLYAQRPLDEQEAALNPRPDRHPHVYGKRRVVVSTNVAETSLTVEGVKHVIDTGYIKMSVWNPVNQVQELHTVRHSKAGCRQRSGRAGRINPGHAYLLYTEEDFEDFPDDSSPEIARASLEQVLLTAKAGGARTKSVNGLSTLDLDWMPLARNEDRRRFEQELARAYQSLVKQGAIDKDGDLTAFGLELRGMPADLHVSRIYLAAEHHGMGVEAANLLPFLKMEHGLQSLLLWDHQWNTEQKFHVRQKHGDLVFGCRDDLDLFIKLALLWDSRPEGQREDWALDYGLNASNFRKSIVEERRKLLESSRDWRKTEDRAPSLERLDALRALIAHCLHDEIYVPLESQQTDAEPGRTRSRFDGPDLLEWQAFWEEGGLYQEYDEELAFDESSAINLSGRSGIYGRRNIPLEKQSEADRIEIIPTSVCFGRTDAEVLAACQRRANFNHPVRAKVLGVNLVRIDRDWLAAIQGTLAERSMLYARLSRQRNAGEHEAVKARLFLPWLLPRGERVRGRILDFGDANNAILEIACRVQDKSALFAPNGELKVRGRIDLDQLTKFQNEPAMGAEIEAHVIGYEIGNDGIPMALLGAPANAGQAFRQFRQQFKVGQVIEVAMARILEDPLGRSPMFVVREPSTGLMIPTADTDFCENTFARAAFGRRFVVGELFQVTVAELGESAAQVSFSRGRQLLREYLALLGGEESRMMQVEALRVDDLGVYVARAGAGRQRYVGFVRHALWPPELSKQEGLVHEARVRRFERQIGLDELAKLAQQKEPLPAALDLGVDFDLLLPLAYERFASQHRVGDRLTGVRVDKPLDSGGLLVSLNQELKAIVWESELGLDEQGRLRKAHSYAPGSEVRAIIISMNAEKKSVRCSLRRMLPPTAEAEPGAELEVVVLLARPDYRNPEMFELACSYEANGRQYASRVTAPRLNRRQFRPGEKIVVQVVKVDRQVNLVEAEYLRHVQS